jgi:hypothetical protein
MRLQSRNVLAQVAFLQGFVRYVIGIREFDVIIIWSPRNCSPHVAGTGVDIVAYRINATNLCILASKNRQ